MRLFGSNVNLSGGKLYLNDSALLIFTGGTTHNLTNILPYAVLGDEAKVELDTTTAILSGKFSLTNLQRMDLLGGSVLNVTGSGGILSVGGAAVLTLSGASHLNVQTGSSLELHHADGLSLVSGGHVTMQDGSSLTLRGTGSEFDLIDMVNMVNFGSGANINTLDTAHVRVSDNFNLLGTQTLNLGGESRLSVADDAILSISDLSRLNVNSGGMLDLGFATARTEGDNSTMTFRENSILRLNVGADPYRHGSLIAGSNRLYLYSRDGDKPIIQFNVSDFAEVGLATVIFTDGYYYYNETLKELTSGKNTFDFFMTPNTDTEGIYDVRYLGGGSYMFIRQGYTPDGLSDNVIRFLDALNIDAPKNFTRYNDTAQSVFQQIDFYQQDLFYDLFYERTMTPDKRTKGAGGSAATSKALTEAVLQVMPNINQVSVHDTKQLSRMVLESHAGRRANDGTSLFVDGLSSSSKIDPDFSKKDKDIPGFKGSIDGATIGINMGTSTRSYGVGYTTAVPKYTSLDRDISGTVHMGSIFYNYTPRKETGFGAVLFAGTATYDTQGWLTGTTDTYKTNYQVTNIGLGAKGSYALTNFMAVYADSIYLNYSRGGYVDNLDNKIDAASGSILTSGAGIKLFHLINGPSNPYHITPHLTLGAVYDILPGTMDASVRKPGGTPYTLIGQDLPTFGYRIALGADFEMAQYSNTLGLSFSANYAIEIRDSLSIHEVSVGVKTKM
jgi:hypothetical protein